MVQSRLLRTQLYCLRWTDIRRQSLSEMVLLHNHAQIDSVDAGNIHEIGESAHLQIGEIHELIVGEEGIVHHGHEVGLLSSLLTRLLLPSLVNCTCAGIGNQVLEINRLLILEPV